MKTEVKYLMIVLLLMLIPDHSLGTYNFFVTIHSLENRGGRCADDQFCNGGDGCCESSKCATTACVYVLEYCQRFPPRSLSVERSVDLAACEQDVRRFAEPISRFERNQTNFGTENPIRFGQSFLMYEVVQIHFELRHNNTVLIDRFLLDVPAIPGYQLTPFYLDGIFGYARMNISVSLECNSNHCGLLCERTTNCSFCDPGYTGIYCSNLISSCGETPCNNSNMKCVNKLLDNDCVCLPGFTGSDCQADIMECSIEDLCSFHGECINTIGSFHCECFDGFTGEFCETRMPRYSVDVTIHSFDNPGGKCADLSGTCVNGTGCCDFRDCRDIHCNYMFLYCLRPLGSAISYFRSENRGSCNFNETNSHYVAERDKFFFNIYGTKNPIKYTTILSPLNRMEFYIELIDDDITQLGDENNELVDRFVIPITNVTSIKEYSGIFGLATISVSLNISCLEFVEDCELNNFEVVTEETTPPPDVSSASTSTLSAVAAVLSVVASLVLFMLVFIAVFCVYYRQCKKKKKSNDISFEMEVTNNPNRGGIARSSRHSNNSLDIQSIRERLESQPNTYQLKNYARRNEVRQEEPSVCVASPLTDETNFTSNYEEIDATQGYSVITEVPGETQSVAAQSSTGQVYSYVCKNEDHLDDDSYDYEAPYWNPSNEEQGLLTQLETLKIPSAKSEEIKEHEFIGSGAFGTVTKATWYHEQASKKCEEIVAVKKIEGGVSEEERILFLKEAVIMGQFGHPNIVKILAIVANGTEEQYQIIMEYMSQGSLRQYLHALDKSTDVLSSQLLAFSRQIASAMSYLSMKGYIHRDLAARNILICDNSTCKISDFGLSRDMCTESFYLARGGKIPVKWAAPESINYRLWSTASDVWSYGCVLYEIWSLGYKPFHNCNNGEVLSKISSGYRLPPPAGCPRAIYHLMINCWNCDSESRPSFCQILSCLNEPEYKILGWSQDDKVQFNEESRKIGGNLEDGSRMYEELQNFYKKV